MLKRKLASLGSMLKLTADTSHQELQALKAEEQKNVCYEWQRPDVGRARRAPYLAVQEAQATASDCLKSSL